MGNSGEIKGFVLKVANSGPHLTFLWTQCNNLGQINYVPGVPRSDNETFLGLHLYLTGCCKNPQSPRDPAQPKSGPEITWLVNVTIYCTMFQ